MSLVNAATKEKLDEVASSVSNFAEVLAADNLNMRTEANLLRSSSEDIRSGIFKMLTMGKFKNGKSTFINALIGRVIMATKAIACTAIIATVKYGEDVNFVRVIYTPESKKNPRKISINKFIDEFSISKEEEKKLAEGGSLTRFADVSHAEMQSTNEMLSGGTQLIDSPGLEENIARTTVTNQFLPKANAVIFMLDATSLFSAKEREYIDNNFAGRHMTNLFFVVNKVNQVVPGQLDNVKAQVEQELREVFKNVAGEFDRELYKRRVFFVDAYGAECIRTGKPYKINVGGREFEIPIALEDTGLIEFETELRNFLNSSERINALINSTLSIMTTSGNSARQKILQAKEIRGESKKIREQKLKEAEKNLEEARKIITKIRRLLGIAAENISEKVYFSLLNFTKKKIPSAFEPQMESFKEKVGWGKILELAALRMASPFINLDKRIEKTSEPIVTYMSAFIKTQVSEWEKSVPDLIKDDMINLQESLSDYVQEFDSYMKKVVNDKDSLQKAITMMTWKNNLQAEAAEGSTFIEAIVEWIVIVTLHIGAIIAVAILAVTLALPIILPAIIIKVIQSSLSESIISIREKLLGKIADKVFNALTKKLEEERSSIKGRIENGFIEKSEEITGTAQGLVEDAERTIATLKNEIALGQEAIEFANARDDISLKKIDNLLKAVKTKLA